ncbi:MAG: histidine kinase [Verrucomicrobiota bacterium]
MAIASTLQKRGIRWLLGFGLWTFIGLTFAFQFYVSSEKAGLDVSWNQAVNYALGDWYVFALLSIAVMALARRFHFESGSRAASVAIHLCGSIAFSFAYMVLRAWVGMWQGGGKFSHAFQPLLVKTWHFNLLIYWVIVAVCFAFDYYRKYRERELSTAELEKQLAQARLHALQMQLNPHFLFNSLHSISALMHEDVERADGMIAQLSDLLRAALAGSETQEVSLRAEFDLLRSYLAIEQIRFGDRLNVNIAAPAEVLDAQVPNLILQPLVENAIRHGIEPHAKPGRIELRAQRANGTLILEVSDNGVGLSPHHPLKEGIGLSNTRTRLRTLYGDAHDFELGRAPESGLVVRLTIPFRTKSNPS